MTILEELKVVTLWVLAERFGLTQITAASTGIVQLSESGMEHISITELQPNPEELELLRRYTPLMTGVLAATDLKSLYVALCASPESSELEDQELITEALRTYVQGLLDVEAAVV